jgi:hypothetical protein
LFMTGLLCGKHFVPCWQFLASETGKVNSGTVRGSIGNDHSRAADVPASAFPAPDLTARKAADLW